MKVLDLKCAQHHVFEGWFASEDDFQSQHARGLVSCPLCGDAQVHKQLSAPRLNLGASPQAEPAPPPAAEPAPSTLPATLPPPEAQAAWMKMMREVVAKTEDVGERFANVARQMHYGEVEERGIRGRTSPKQAMELLEEGIGVMPLPPSLNEPLQ
jgi:hypothetical protein